MIQTYWCRKDAPVPGLHRRSWIIAVGLLVGCQGDPSSLPAETVVATTEVAPSTRPGNDWPGFLGPQGTSESTETGLIQDWPAGGPPRLWTRALGEGYAAPSVMGERVVVQHRLKDRELVECLHAETGETLWKTDYPTDFRDPYGYNGGTRCSPVLTAERCYTYGPQGKLLCVNLQTGATVWQVDTAQTWTVPEHFFGAGCTPILEGDTLYVLVGGHPNSGIVAFDAATGKVRWESVGQATWDGVIPDERGGRPTKLTTKDALVSYSTPIIATLHGQKVLLALMRQGLVGVDPRTGSVKFKYWFRSKLHESVNAARPLVIGEDRIYLSAAYDTGSAYLKVSPSLSEVEVLHRNRDGLATHWSTPLVIGEHVYGFSGRHEQEARLQCRALATGQLLWETSGWDRPLDEIEQDESSGRLKDRKTGQAIPWPFLGRGSKLRLGDRFVILGERGTLAWATLSPQGYVEHARLSYPELKYPTWAAPVLSRGRLLLRSESHLVCLDLQQKP